VPDLARPWVLLALPVALVFALGRRIPSLPTPHTSRAGQELTSPSALTRLLFRLPDLLRGGALVLLAVALAGPLTRSPVPLPAEERNAVFLLLDRSPSMAHTEDGDAGGFLDAAVTGLERFVRNRKGGALLGLATFHRRPELRVPLTDHRKALLRALAAVTAPAEEEGTALGPALAEAGRRLEGVPAGRRAVLLASDGEDNASGIDPLSVARALAERGIEVHVLSLGHRGDPGFLRSVARAGGGSYRSAEAIPELGEAFVDASSSVPRIRAPSLPRPDRATTEGLLGSALILLLMELLLQASSYGRLP